MTIYVTTDPHVAGRWQLAHGAYVDREEAERQFPDNSADPFLIEVEVDAGCTLVYSVQSLSPTSSCKIELLTGKKEEAEELLKILNNDTGENGASECPHDPEGAAGKWENWIVEIPVTQ